YRTIDQSRSLLGGRGKARNLHVDSPKEGGADEVELFPPTPPEADVVRRRVAVNDAAKPFALRIENPDPACAAGINVARVIHLHAIRIAGFAAGQVREDTVGLLRERAVGKDIEGPYVAAPRIDD